MRNLPAPLAPLEENRQGLFAALDLLDQTPGSVTRVDLAGELDRICARYEDVKERVVYPALRATSADEREFEQAEEDQQAVRAALSEIRHRTQHVKPANFHVDDPEGFEEAFGDAIEAIRAHSEREDKLPLRVLSEIDEQATVDLRRNVERAVAHASPHSNPPHNPLARAFVAIEEWLEHGIQDQFTLWRPSVHRLNDALDYATTADDPRDPKSGNDPAA